MPAYDPYILDKLDDEEKALPLEIIRRYHSIDIWKGEVMALKKLELDKLALYLMDTFTGKYKKNINTTVLFGLLASILGDLEGKEISSIVKPLLDFIEQQ